MARVQTGSSVNLARHPVGGNRPTGLLFERRAQVAEDVVGHVTHRLVANPLVDAVGGGIRHVCVEAAESAPFGEESSISPITSGSGEPSASRAGSTLTSSSIWRTR